MTDHESSDPQGELFNMPSYQDWLNKMNSHLDAKQVPPVTTQRAWLAAAETPLKFFIAVAYRAAVPGTRSYLRRQGRKPAVFGSQADRTAGLAQLPDCQS